MTIADLLLILAPAFFGFLFVGGWLADRSGRR